MVVNGMLVLAIPQMTYWDYTHNRLVVNQYSNQLYNYNLVNVMYMLALSGFDCRDAYFYRETNTPWLHVAVYATEHDPLPAGASWHDIADRRLVNDSVINCLNKYGHVKLNEVVVSWLDKSFYKITD
jgi:hypothetical protein